MYFERSTGGDRTAGVLLEFSSLDAIIYLMQLTDSVVSWKGASAD